MRPLSLKCLIHSLPKDVLGKCHAFHQGNRRQVDAICDVTNSVYAGYGCLIEAVHLDLALGSQLNTNLHPSMRCWLASICYQQVPSLLCLSLCDLV